MGYYANLLASDYQMPVVNGKREIPGYIKNEDEAMEYASSDDREHKYMVWLIEKYKSDKSTGYSCFDRWLINKNGLDFYQHDQKI